MMAVTGTLGGGGEDPHWSNVALLLHGDNDPNGRLLNDSSSYQHNMYANNRISLQTSPTPPYGTSSIQVANATNALYTKTLSSPAIGTGDFTVEYSVYQDSLNNWHTHFGCRTGSGGNYLAQASNTWNMGVNGSGFLFVHRTQNNPVSFGVNGFTAGAWHDIALVRSSGTWAMWLNGSRVDTDTNYGSTNFNTKNYGIGTGANNYATAERLRGHIMNLRFTVGVARYNPSDTTIPTPTELFPIG